MLRLSLQQQDDLRDNDEGPFSALSVLGEAARYMRDDEMREQYDEALSAMIEGQAQSEAADRMVEGNGLPLVDRITADIALHIGADPIFVLALAIALDGHAAIELDGELMLILSAYTPSDSPVPFSSAWLGDDILWDPRGVVIAMPETLALGSVGRPLSSILTHPVLDRYPQTIVDVREMTPVSPAGKPKVKLVTDFDRTPLETKALFDLRHRWRNR